MVAFCQVARIDLHEQLHEIHRAEYAQNQVNTMSGPPASKDASEAEPQVAGDGVTRGLASVGGEGDCEEEDGAT